ncbi:uncharacterized protein LOC129947469 [Eupeodes corollae]|uniref:uncharacterized protein LOC129947469 n=1 Tax=Eupeodes corollae TaxID=290404 RepID=UPI0024902729|nr:uncharacterized protein LOC129947469 [Eupeodes corollae]
MESSTTTSDDEENPNQSVSISYIEIPPSYGRPTLQSVENISLVGLQNISGPFKLADHSTINSYQQSEDKNYEYHNLTSSNFETDHSQATEETFKQLLKSWNLEHLTEFLTSEKINIEILKIIKRRHINMLFKTQKIGDLVVFEQSLAEWRSSLSLFVDEEESESLHERGNQKPLSIASCNSSPTTSKGIESPDPSDVFISLSDIMNENVKSKIITDYYERYSKLQDEHRSMLISMICNYFQENYYHMSLGTSYRLENEILKRFSGEKLEYYRVGRRGKIYAKACNDKRCFRSLLKRTLAPEPDGPDTPKVESTNPRKIQFSPEGDAEESIRSLKYDNLSAMEFDSCWQSCSQYRMKNIQEASSLESIFAKWPEYKYPTGYRLIDKDFAIVFGSRPGILSRWPEQATALKNFLLRGNHLKDKPIREMLQEIGDSDMNKDTTAAKMMWCLHFFLIPTQKAVKKDNTGKKRVVKFTVHSSQQAFLFLAPSVQEMDNHLEFLKSKGENIQPFILGLGDNNFNTISNFYVYLDGVKFIFNSFLRAVDICFKAFHLFNLEYPLACSQFWSFIENHFYDMKSSKNTSSKMFVLSEELRGSSS